MKIQKKQAGFTLVELITVVSMLALLTIFVAREIGQSSDDIKQNLVVTTLLSSFPAAISSFKGANFGNCTSNAGADIIITDLVDRGVPALSPWGTAWAFTNYTAATRQLVIGYDVAGANNSNLMATDIAATLADNAVFFGDPTAAGSVVTVTYSC